MGRHVAALGFLYGLVGLMASGLGALVLIVGGSQVGQIVREVLELIGYGHLARWLGAGFALALLVSALASLVTAFGLFTRRPWGRVLGLLGSAAQVATLSWASLLGIYGLWVLLSRDGAREFGGPTLH